MSLFKEKDDLLKAAFQDIFDQESDEDVDEDDSLNISRGEESTRRNIASITNDDLKITKLCGDESFEPSIDSSTADDSDHDDESPNKKLKLNFDSANQSQKKRKEKIQKQKTDEEVVLLSSDDETSIISDDSIIFISETNASRVSKKVNSSNGSELNLTSSSIRNNNNISLNSSSMANNISQDLEDRPFKLKFRLAGYYEQVSTTYKTKLSMALEENLNKLRAKGKTLIFSHSGKPISLNDSPHSIQLTPGVILDAIEISIKYQQQNESSITQTKDTEDSNRLSVKLQDGNRKNTKEFKILIDEPFSILKERYARDINLPSAEMVKFYFDGDLVEDDSTPKDLEIDDEFTIDVKVLV